MGGGGVSEENTALLEKKTLEPLLAGVSKNLEEFKKSKWPLSFFILLPTLQA